MWEAGSQNWQAGKCTCKTDPQGGLHNLHQTLTKDALREKVYNPNHEFVQPHEKQFPESHLLPYIRENSHTENKRKSRTDRNFKVIPINQEKTGMTKSQVKTHESKEKNRADEIKTQ